MIKNAKKLSDVAEGTIYLYFNKGEKHGYSIK